MPEPTFLKMMIKIIMNIFGAIFKLKKETLKTSLQIIGAPFNHSDAAR